VLKRILAAVLDHVWDLLPSALLIGLVAGASMPLRIEF
jgi:hypothetical protein